MKRYGGVALIVMGVILSIATGIRALVAQDEMTVEATVAPSGAVVATAPGVLEMVDSTVHVKLDAQGQQIQWALGSAHDVDAWIGKSAGSRLTGLTSWTEPKITVLKGDKEQSTQDTKLGSEKKFSLDSDWWHKSGHGKDRVEFDVTASSGSQDVLVATTTSAQAPKLTLTWQHSVAKASPWSTIAIGVLLTLVGLFLLLQDWQERDMRERRSRRAAARAAQTTPLETFDGDLSQEERPLQRKHTDRAYGAGILPGTSRSMALRNRPLDDDNRLTIDVERPRTTVYDGQNRPTIAAASGGTLGAGVVPGSARAQELRHREVASWFPEELSTQTEPINADPESISEATHTESAELVTGMVNIENGKDWRSRWSIRSKGENDA
ncbi:hypothetical protein ACTOVL_03060 [Arcanobacterium canis]